MTEQWHCMLTCYTLLECKSDRIVVTDLTSLERREGQVWIWVLRNVCMDLVMIEPFTVRNLI